MIRFQPDNLREALARFFDMAAPDANVYIEIPAPDVRMGAVLLLAVAVAVWWRRLEGRRAPALAMLALLLASTPIWLYTTGNGRYFLPMLICAGPIAIGLLCMLPLERTWKALLATGLAALQVFVLAMQPPWHGWGWVDWANGPYFDVKVPGGDSGRRVTYATLSTNTYSLIAPQFPASASWISLSSGGGTPRDEATAAAFLRRAAAEGEIRLIVPSIAGAMLEGGLPNAQVIDAMDKLVAGRNVHISGGCALLPSMTQARLQGLQGGEKGDSQRPAGFWTCPLAYEERQTDQAPPDEPPEQVRRTLERLAELCPRFFPEEKGGMVRLSDGWIKHYGSDTRVYVMDSGAVWYKFWRSMNAVHVGEVKDMLTGKTGLDCSAIRGYDRPWRTGAR